MEGTLGEPLSSQQVDKSMMHEAGLFSFLCVTSKAVCQLTTTLSLWVVVNANRVRFRSFLQRRILQTPEVQEARGAEGAGQMHGSGFLLFFGTENWKWVAGGGGLPVCASALLMGHIRYISEKKEKMAVEV